MRRRIWKKWSVAMLCFCMLSACGTKTNKSEQQLIFEQLLDHMGTKLTDGYYMLIPLEGCEHCVPLAVAFSKRHLNNKNIRFIISAQGGKKRIARDYTDKESAAPGIILDPREEFVHADLLGGFVTLFKVSDGNLGPRQELDPNEIEEKLEELEKELK